MNLTVLFATFDVALVATLIVTFYKYVIPLRNFKKNENVPNQPNQLENIDTIPDPEPGEILMNRLKEFQTMRFSPQFSPPTPGRLEKIIPPPPSTYRNHRGSIIENRPVHSSLVNMTLKSGIKNED